MTLLVIYVSVALIFSFLCSIAEAVILSITPAYIATLEKNSPTTGNILKKLKADINKPLAAILTLNTIAHTTGAAGAGAQAAVVFGSGYIGVASAVLTLLILFLSEIIPKTVGTIYWRELAPATTISLKYLVKILFPFVWLSEKVTSMMLKDSSVKGFSREEFSAMAELSANEGTIAAEEFTILKNLLLQRETRVEEAMTPRTVVFSLNEELLVEEFFHKYDQTPFSRILVYSEDKENINGFVMRRDLLLAQARGNGKNSLKKYRRNVAALLNTSTMSHAFGEILRQQAQLMLVVDEYGTVKGIVTMEDLFETLLGLEIIDERDETEDMQQLAKKIWNKRAKERGVKVRK